MKLLNNLGSAVSKRSMFKDGRPGNILDYVHEKFGESVPADGLLRAVLEDLERFGGEIDFRRRESGRCLEALKWTFGSLP